jgi:uncharacterized protein (TIGR00375 family)
VRFIADFHIHSRFSVATSKELTPENLHRWAGIKGMTLVGTGDCTHPGWLAELRSRLVPAEPGLYRLEPGAAAAAAGGPEGAGLPGAGVPGNGAARFMLTAEISSIYKQGGRVRKVHNQIFAPDFEGAEALARRLSRIGNITSDGCPILGLDSRDLLEMVLECSEERRREGGARECAEGFFFVPSHIWTPWFSALGSRSGFDSIQQCYRDLTGHVHAVETGLSSDPPMNWRCSFLDRYTLISNSDAHSPEKLGREANLLDTELRYDRVIQALRGEGGFLGTVEFFPQEGKYHYDGHRKCGVRMHPAETARAGGLCPRCGKPLTTGVLSRVMELSDRENPEQPAGRSPFHSLIPLKELLSEITGTGPGARRVARYYEVLVGRGGSELRILLDLPVDEIRRLDGELLAEAVRRMRCGQVHIESGYDGEYGRVRAFEPGEVDRLKGGALFALQGSLQEHRREPAGNVDADAARGEGPSGGTSGEPRGGPCPPGGAAADGVHARPAAGGAAAGTGDPGLNPEQERAAEHGEGPALVLAGPGTGKTRVLTRRIARLIRQGTDPRSILAVTFTNRAASAMSERIGRLAGERAAGTQVGTFHALGRRILAENAEESGRTPGFLVAGERDRLELVARALEETTGGGTGTGVRPAGGRTAGKAGTERWARRISEAKRELADPGALDPETAAVLARYDALLAEADAFDLDDLVAVPARLLGVHPALLQSYRDRFRWVLIDEYQDINRAQYELIRTLAPGPRANLFAIGDPDQAIYGFRGADSRYIDRFLEDYPGAAVYALSRSYRCSPPILRASTGLLEGPGRPPGTVSAAGASVSEGPGGEGPLVRIVSHRSDRSEAEFVARTIEQLMGGLRFFSMDSAITGGEEADWSFADFAVLCRLKEQMTAVREAFHNHGIPCQPVDIEPFYRREPACHLADLLAWAARPRNPLPGGRLERLGIATGAGPPRLSPGPVRDSARLLARTYLAGRPDPEGLLDRFYGLCGDFGEDLGSLLMFLETGTGQDTFRSSLEEVALLTMHASKGLEFRCVFIVGCEEGIIPCTLPGRRPDPEEERRLLYVGMTRAGELLVLCHADRRVLYGRELRLPRSSLIAGILEQLEAQRQAPPPSRRAGGQMELF